MNRRKGFQTAVAGVTRVADPPGFARPHQSLFDFESLR
jgi:hypothetical protein